MNVEGSKYTERGRVEQQVLFGLRSHLTAAERLNKVADSNGDNLKGFVSEFGVNRTVNEIRGEMAKMKKEKRFKVKVATEPAYLARATELTMLLIAKTEKENRVNDRESMAFMKEVDGIFMPENEDDGREWLPEIQETRTKAVKILTEKYKKARNGLELNIDNDESGDKLTKAGVVREVLNGGRRNELARLLLETKVKDLESEYKKAGLETEVKETKIETEEEEADDLMSSESGEDVPEKMINWNWNKISFLTIATFSTAAVSTAVISQGLVISGLMPEISSELTRVAMGTAGAGLLSAAGFLGLKFLRRNLRASTVEASVTPEPVILAVVPDSLRKTVEGLTTKKDLKLSGIAYKVGDETAANQDLINHTAPIADCLRENTLFVLPVILYGHTADDIDEANTHLMVFINNNQYKISIAGNDFDTLFLNNLNNDANEKPRLNIITAINEIHRANSLNPIGITFGSYLLYNNSLTMAGLNDLITDIRDKKIGLDHFISNSTIVYTR